MHLCLHMCEWLFFNLNLALLHVFVIRHWRFTNSVDTTIASLTPLFSWLKGVPPGINPSSRQQKKRANVLASVFHGPSMLCLAVRTKIDPTLVLFFIESSSWRKSFQFHAKLLSTKESEMSAVNGILGPINLTLRECIIGCVIYVSHRRNKSASRTNIIERRYINNLHPMFPFKPFNSRWLWR